jgi:hypothetical protein
MNDFVVEYFDIVTPYPSVLAMFIRLFVFCMYCLDFLLKDKIFRHSVRIL